jgi:predicted nucleic acid-binding protein
VIEAVLDASVVLDWFQPNQPDAAAAITWRRAFEAGRLVVMAPPLLQLEIVNVAGRRWHWPAAALADLALKLHRMGFTWQAPPLAATVPWVFLGLTAYDAEYVALAETEEIRLITADALILQTAPHIACSPGQETPDA